MSIFRRTSPGSADIDRVRSEIGRLNETLERYGERAKQFEDALTAQPDAAALVGRIEALDEAVTSRPGGADSDLAARLDARLDELAAQLATLDQRLTSVSTELANQLSELGSDIESLHQRPAAAVDEEAIGGLRETQTRLASEQARYQIAFREDLARLAEQLRRPAGDVRRRA